MKVTQMSIDRRITQAARGAVSTLMQHAQYGRLHQMSTDAARSYLEAFAARSRVDERFFSHLIAAAEDNARHRLRKVRRIPPIRRRYFDVTRDRVLCEILLSLSMLMDHYGPPAMEATELTTPTI